MPDEELLKYGLPTDVWFHVEQVSLLVRTHRSKLSSAHVYLRQTSGTWDKLPLALVDDAAQLVKANSIEGDLALV